MRFPAVAVLALVAGCGLFKRDHEHEQTTSPTEELNARADAYCALEDAAADEHGFVGHDCDLVLFNALRHTGCGNVLDFTAAEDPTKPGEWHRDPQRACYPDGRTSARFSRDMGLGVLYWAWSQGPSALPVIERLIAYVEANDGYLCEAKDAAIRTSRCHVSDGYAATMYELRYRLGGADSSKRAKSAVFDPLADGFERHVQALHLYLRGLMFGAVSDPELATLEQYGKANALFDAMARKFQTGDLEAVTRNVVGDGQRFPAGRLPGSTDRCTNYLWQRNEGEEWLPCPLVNDDGTLRSPESYDGVDLVFFRAVVADKLPVGDVVPALAATEPRVHRYRRNGE